MENKVTSKIFHVEFQVPQLHISVSSQYTFYVFTVCKLWPKYMFLSLMLLMGAKV